MVGSVIENNTVTVSGRVFSDMEFSHEVYGEGFYYFMVEVPRLSDSNDKIPVTVSERLMTKRKPEIGSVIEVEGQFRSYNNYSAEGNRLLLTVFAREIIFLDDISMVKNPNSIFLNGFLCKKPVYRTTPFGREIADLLLAVNRPYNKSDYIPCIAWGRNARYCEGLKIGNNIKVWGRVQSRQYQKRTHDDEVVARVAYEVSVSKLEVIEDEHSSKIEADANCDGQNS